MDQDFLAVDCIVFISVLMVGICLIFVFHNTKYAWLFSHGDVASLVEPRLIHNVDIKLLLAIFGAAGVPFDSSLSFTP